MSKKKSEYIGWGFVKDIIREYSEITAHSCRLKPFQADAVKQAVDETKSFVDGTERLKLIDLVFWKQTHTLAGAACECNVSYDLAVIWHRDFIKAVGRNMNIF